VPTCPWSPTPFLGREQPVSDECFCESSPRNGLAIENKYSLKIHERKPAWIHENWTTFTMLSISERMALTAVKNNGSKSWSWLVNCSAFFFLLHFYGVN
jgi:hypothetical protein